MKAYTILDMDAFIHWLVFACPWLDDHYIGLCSTGKMTMKVYLKKANTVAKALHGAGRWAKQPYVLPWWMVMYYWWYDPEGYEALLYSNDLPGEEGITITWRYMRYHASWESAKLSLVGEDNWSHCI